MPASVAPPGVLVPCVHRGTMCGVAGRCSTSPLWTVQRHPCPPHGAYVPLFPRLLIGHAGPPQRAAPLTKVWCSLIRPLRGVGAQSICACLLKALRARWCISLTMAATPSPNVIGDPRAVITSPNGRHATSAPPMRNVPPSPGLLCMIAVLFGLICSPCRASFFARVASSAWRWVGSWEHRCVSSMYAPPDSGGGGPLAGWSRWLVSLSASFKQSATILLKRIGLSGERPAAAQRAALVPVSPAPPTGLEPHPG